MSLYFFKRKVQGNGNCLIQREKVSNCFAPYKREGKHRNKDTREDFHYSTK